MGSSESKTTTEQISHNISTIASETVQECVIKSDQRQQVNLDNVGWSFGSSYSITQQTDVSQECFSDVRKQMELQTRLINDIMQETTSTGQAVWPAFGNTTASAHNTIKNIVESNVTMRNIQKSYMEIRQDQTVNFRNAGVMAFSEVEISQGAKLFAAATLKEVERSGIFTTIENYVDQSAAAKTAGPLDQLFGSLSTAMILALVFIIVVFLAIIGVVVWYIASSYEDEPQKVQSNVPSTAPVSPEAPLQAD